MTQTAESPITTLRSRMRGDVVDSTASAYTTRPARSGTPASTGRPLVIARCLDEADVQAAVRFATEPGLEIAVRGGAHAMSGTSVVDGGIVIDLGRMNQVRVDPDARRAVVAGGALLGDVDAATQAHGLAVPAGLVSHTGVGGLTLGGGMGWLARLGGLTIDNLVAARVVTADGAARVASPDGERRPVLGDPGWWRQLRGGHGVRVRTARGRADDPLRAVVLVARPGPRDAAPRPRRHRRVARRRQRDGRRPQRAARALRPRGAPARAGVRGHRGRHRLSRAPRRDLRSARAGRVPTLRVRRRPCLTSSCRRCSTRPTPGGYTAYDKGCYVEELSDDVIDVITEHFPQKTSPLSLVLFYRLDGAYSRVAEDATAFGGGRSPRFGVFMIGVCPVSEMLPGEREWVRSMADALRPSAADDGLYVNGMTDFDARSSVEMAYGPEKYARLRGDQVEVRPRQRVPAQRQHPADATLTVSRSSSAPRWSSPRRAGGSP